MDENSKCKKVKELLIDYISGNLDPKENDYVKSHLNKCKKCKKEFEELNKTLVLLDFVDYPEPGSKFTKKILKRIEKETEKEDEEKVKETVKEKVFSRVWLRAAVFLVCAVGIFFLSQVVFEKDKMLVNGKAEKHKQEEKIVADKKLDEQGKEKKEQEKEYKTKTPAVISEKQKLKKVPDVRIQKKQETQESLKQPGEKFGLKEESQKEKETESKIEKEPEIKPEKTGKYPEKEMTEKSPELKDEDKQKRISEIKRTKKPLASKSERITKEPEKEESFKMFYGFQETSLNPIEIKTKKIKSAINKIRKYVKKYNGSILKVRKYTLGIGITAKIPEEKENKFIKSIKELGKVLIKKPFKNKEGQIFILIEKNNVK